MNTLNENVLQGPPLFYSRIAINTHFFTFQKNNNKYCNKVVVFKFAHSFKFEAMKVILSIVLYASILSSKAVGLEPNGGIGKDDMVIKIVPKRRIHSDRNRFRANAIQTKNDAGLEHVLRQAYLDLSEVVSLKRGSFLETLNVQLFDDEESISFHKQFGSVDSRGFYWYGESRLDESSLSIQVHGRNCAG